jgi:hypothetical protein
MLRYITYRFSDSERAKTTMFVITLFFSAFALLIFIIANVVKRLI